MVFIGFVFVPPELSKAMLKNIIKTYKSLKDEVLAIKTEVSKITEEEDCKNNHYSQTPSFSSDKANEDKSYAAIEQEAKIFTNKAYTISNSN